MHSFDAFLFFDGDCRQALDFYRQVFAVEATMIMTYGQAPDAPPDSPDADRVLYSEFRLPATNLMLSDRPSGQPHVVGNSVALTLGFADEAELRRQFAALTEGGTIGMPLAKTFFSPLYGMVTDRYGVIWQLTLFEEQTG